MHCDLLAADIFPRVSAHAQDCACDEDLLCSNDGCHEVENTLMRQEEDGALPAPALHDQCLCLLCLQCLASNTAEDTSEQCRSDSPILWVPSWSFERRAAAPPRAP